MHRVHRKSIQCRHKVVLPPIQNIDQNRQYIIDDACKTCVCSLVKSRLDYGNALLYELNASLANTIQRVQNTAASLVTPSKKHNHIIPVRISLYWFPLQYRIK